MKRQFTAGAAAKREVKHLKNVIGNKNDSIVKANNLVSNLHGVVDRWTNDYEKLQTRYYDLIANNKANVMRLENEQKQALQQFKKDRETLFEQVNFYKQLNNIAAADEKKYVDTIYKQKQLIDIQQKELMELDDKYYHAKKGRENLTALLISLVLSIIIILVW